MAGYVAGGGANATATGLYLAAHPGASADVARKNASRFMASTGLAEVLKGIDVDGQAVTAESLVREYARLALSDKTPAPTREKALRFLVTVTTGAPAEGEQTERQQLQHLAGKVGLIESALSALLSLAEGLPGGEARSLAEPERFLAPSPGARGQGAGVQVVEVAGPFDTSEKKTTPPASDSMPPADHTEA